MLLDRGIDEGMVDSDGATALTPATKKDHHSLARLIQNHKQRIQVMRDLSYMLRQEFADRTHAGSGRIGVEAHVR